MLVNHIGITVGDIDAAVEWYGGVFGLTVLVAPQTHTNETPGADRRADVFGSEWGSMKLAHLADESGVGIELFEFVVPPNREPEEWFEYRRLAVSHIAFTVDDMEATIEKLVALGGKARTSVHEIPSGTRICYCEDPWGTAIELCTTSYTRLTGN